MEAIEFYMSIKITIRLKDKFYKMFIRISMMYGSECWIIKKQHTIILAW